MVDGADCDLSAFFSGVLEGEVRAAFSGGLEDHALRVGGIDAAVFLDAGRVDDEDIEVKAASSATQAEHAAKVGWADYCRLRLPQFALAFNLGNLMSLMSSLAQPSRPYRDSWNPLLLPRSQ